MVNKKMLHENNKTNAVLYYDEAWKLMGLYGLDATKAVYFKENKTGAKIKYPLYYRSNIYWFYKLNKFLLSFNFFEIQFKFFILI